MSQAAGILLSIAAVMCFSGLDATAKWSGQAVPPLQVVGMRYLSGFVFIVLLCRPWSRPGVIWSRSPRLQVWRGLSLVAATVCSFVSLHYLPLAQVAAIQFAAPLLIAACAGPVLGERLGLNQAAAVVAGFAGVIVVTRPGFGMHWAVLVAVATAAWSAVYALLTRHMAGRDRPRTTLLWSGLVGAAAVLPMLAAVWVPPPPRVWAAVVLMGVLATLGHYLLIEANERAPASVLAPFSYTQIVAAVALGWLVFGDVPDGWTFAGGAIVVGSGLYLLVSERRVKNLH